MPVVFDQAGTPFSGTPAVALERTRCQSDLAFAESEKDVRFSTLPSSSNSSTVQTVTPETNSAAICPALVMSMIFRICISCSVLCPVLAPRGRACPYASQTKTRHSFKPVERIARIELAFSAWKADVLPLHHTRMKQCFVRPRTAAAESRALPSARTHIRSLNASPRRI